MPLPCAASPSETGDRSASALVPSSVGRHRHGTICTAFVTFCVTAWINPRRPALGSLQVAIYIWEVRSSSLEMHFGVTYWGRGRYVTVSRDLEFCTNVRHPCYNPQTKQGFGALIKKSTIEDDGTQ